MLFASLSILVASLRSQEISADRVEAEKLETLKIGPDAADPGPVRVKSDIRTADAVVVGNRASFIQGVHFLKPLGDVSMGAFTNVPGRQADTAAYPGWWERRSVTDGSETNDYAMAVQGQVKWMAHQALEEFTERMSAAGGAGPAVSNLVSAFTTTGNCIPVTLGQLKNTAKPFYDRLAEFGIAAGYPWTGGAPDDFALANIGQVKNLFYFDLTAGSDNDGIPDWWEVASALHPFSDADASADPDGDGLSNLQEFLTGTDPLNNDTDGDDLTDYEELYTFFSDPTKKDSDGDGYDDKWEIEHGLNPLESDDSLSDNDGDGLTLEEEYAYNTDPDNADTDGDGLDDCEEVFSRVVEWGEWYGYFNPKPDHIGQVVAIGAGQNRAIALLKNGSVVCWGMTDYANLTQPPADLTNAVSVEAGTWHYMALKDDGTVSSWLQAGEQNQGQCAVPQDLTDAVAISAGFLHSVALTSEGKVRCWGFNDNGESTVPAGLSNVVSVSAGSFHTAALKNDGAVVCWGQNWYGECDMPAGLDSVVDIKAGGHHTVALKSDGTVVCWGANSYGQCNVPPGLSGVVKIAVGTCHSLAFTRDGQIIGWGANDYGQLDVDKVMAPVLGEAAGRSLSFTLYQGNTDPNDPDSDDDGLTDAEEFLQYKTDPNKADTDGDGFTDGDEVINGFDPLDPLDPPISLDLDTDGDGMSDYWEAVHGLSRFDPDDAALDADGDGLSNLDEYLLNSDPGSAAIVLPDSSSVSSPQYGSGATGLLILTPDAVRH